MIDLHPVPINSENFAPFGQVISLDNAHSYPINQGLTTRFHDLMDIDVSDEGGRPIVNVFRTQPLPLPHVVKIMERHPLGSQAFIPLDGEPFLVLVAPPQSKLQAEDLRLFVTDGCQGVNFYKNTWHHFQIVTDHCRDFIVIDRGGDGENLEETEVIGDARLT